MSATQYYKEMYLDGVDSTTISQTVQAIYGLSNQELSVVADKGVAAARQELGLFSGLQ